MISLHHFPHGCLSMFPMFKYARDEKKKLFSDFPRIERIPPTTKATLGNLKTHWKMIFVRLVYFRALKRKPVRCKSDGAFQFRFLVPSRQRNQKKSSSCCYGKIFCERKPSSTHLNLGEMLLREQKANPERAEMLHLPRLVSQSQCGI